MHTQGESFLVPKITHTAATSDHLPTFEAQTRAHSTLNRWRHKKLQSGLVEIYDVIEMKEFYWLRVPMYETEGISKTHSYGHVSLQWKSQLRELARARFLFTSSNFLPDGGQNDAGHKGLFLVPTKKATSASSFARL